MALNHDNFYIFQNEVKEKNPIFPAQNFSNLLLKIGELKMEQSKIIKLPCFGIVVELNDQDCGIIQSTLQETCPYCTNLACNGNCEEWMELIRQSSEARREKIIVDMNDFIAYRFGVHALESLILGHAVAGVDITDLTYIQGIETAVDALGNNI